ncbi:unnamed protein product [Anisakis simplex]|uniref:F-box/LRR-repeat protein 20 n=1 Tax=Anisakis simplex TaxID=6269 RepID=A0A0M3JYQ8_ANISI|nr:unnamed protein product [Anisakis simplex]
MTADVLNTDCLIQVFQNLAFFERVRLERMNACYSNITELNVADFLGTNSGNCYQQDSLLFAPTVVGIVERCGRYVHRISFGQRWQKISQAIVDTIAVYCNRLRELDLSCVIMNADISALLDKTAENLEIFSLEETSWVRNEDGNKVQEYFYRMKKLRKINLRRAMFNLDKLHELPECLEFLELSGAHKFPVESFNEFLKTHPYLKELALCPLPVADLLTLEYLSNLPRLIDLQIGYVLKEPYDFPMLSLALCVSLQSLHFQCCNALTTRDLRVILEELQNLRSLTIINCAKIFDYSCLSFCRRVEQLTIANTIQISDDDLTSIAVHQQLRSLTIQSCVNVTNASIIIVLRNCTLREITLVNCENIGDETLYTLASSKHIIHSIAVQGCRAVTSKGVAALALLKHIDKLRELDVSHNRNIDDMAILSLHNGLVMKRRKKALLNSNGGKDTKTNGRNEPNDSYNKLTIYVFKTSVSKKVDKRVDDLITLTN